MLASDSIDHFLLGYQINFVSSQNPMHNAAIGMAYGSIRIKYHTNRCDNFQERIQNDPIFRLRFFRHSP